LRDHDFSRNHTVPEQVIEDQVRTIFSLSIDEMPEDRQVESKEACCILEIEQLSLFAA
jgi:predicted kinase